jgi:hypothetical protein
MIVLKMNVRCFMNASVAASHEGDISGAVMEGISRAGDGIGNAQKSCALNLADPTISDIIGYLWVKFWVFWPSPCVYGYLWV